MKIYVLSKAHRRRLVTSWLRLSSSSNCVSCLAWPALLCPYVCLPASPSAIWKAAKVFGASYFTLISFGAVAFSGRKLSD